MYALVSRKNKVLKNKNNFFVALQRENNFSIKLKFS